MTPDEIWEYLNKFGHQRPRGFAWQNVGYSQGEDHHTNWGDWSGNPRMSYTSNPRRNEKSGLYVDFEHCLSGVVLAPGAKCYCGHPMKYHDWRKTRNRPTCLAPKMQVGRLEKCSCPGYYDDPKTIVIEGEFTVQQGPSNLPARR